MSAEVQRCIPRACTTTANTTSSSSSRGGHVSVRASEAGGRLSLIHMLRNTTMFFIGRYQGLTTRTHAPTHTRAYTHYSPPTPATPTPRSPRQGAPPSGTRQDADDRLLQALEPQAAAIARRPLHGAAPQTTAALDGCEHHLCNAQ